MATVRVVNSPTWGATGAADITASMQTSAAFMWSTSNQEASGFAFAHYGEAKAVEHRATIGEESRQGRTSGIGSLLSDEPTVDCKPVATSTASE
ncbi:MAG: hypothetical protein C0483_08100 [Pirellula sp.]|nr:hypothetical protein [Pirellula sp.]